MAYDLDQFIADCRTSLERDSGPAGREEVRKRLERLLGNGDFVNAHCSDDAPNGVKILYEDPKLGFQVLSHCYDNPRASPPHDHGESWAIYGQAAKYTDMTEWERTENGDPRGHADLKPVKKYRLNPGQVGIYQDGRIHSIDYPAKARFIRVTGVDLERIPRSTFDIATGVATRVETRTTN
jgi:predicted metal-dependent enzyme (double-stranded beta helix superfamily)